MWSGAALKELPSRRTADYEEAIVTVTSPSGFVLRKVFYGTPSRLIGHRLRVRLYDDRLDVYLGGSHQMTMPRGRAQTNGKHDHVVDYRHVIHALRRKPMALMGLVYRDKLLPRQAYARAFEAMVASLPARLACRTMVDLLALPHDRACEAELGEQLAQDLDAGRLPDMNRLRVRFTPDAEALPEIVVIYIPLSLYAELATVFTEWPHEARRSHRRRPSHLGATTCGCQPSRPSGLTSPPAPTRRDGQRRASQPRSDRPPRPPARSRHRQAGQVPPVDPRRPGLRHQGSGLDQRPLRAHQRSCERRSMLITANQAFGEWGRIFPDQAMTLAAVDRLVHHATIFEMNVENFRRRTAIERKTRARTSALPRDIRSLILIVAPNALQPLCDCHAASIINPPRLTCLILIVARVSSRLSRHTLATLLGLVRYATAYYVPRKEGFC
jgi:hypothetical protein